MPRTSLSKSGSRKDEEHFNSDGNDVVERSTALHNPGKLLMTIFACIGVFAVVQNAAQYFSYSFRDVVFPVDTLSRPNLNPARLHPLDLTMTHHRNNTGLVGSGVDIKRKAIVMASMSSENTEWVHEELADWESNIYVVDNQHANLTVFLAHGHEAAVYLTYIINHYYVLPDYTAFLHAKRYQWHNEDPMYDGVQPMKNLRLEHVEKVGYASLRCSWDPGCPVTIFPNATQEDQGLGWHGAYSRVLISLFPDRPLPERIGTPCCAQFALSRATIRATPLRKYEEVRQWLWETEMSDGQSGRIMEYLWHVLFGQEAVTCPNTEQCFCDKFGLCDLSCPKPGMCQGRFRAPPWNQPMPEKWPFEGQGIHGYPKYGWWQKWYPEQDFGLEYIKEGMEAMAVTDTSPDMSAMVSSANEQANSEKLDEITFEEPNELVKGGDTVVHNKN